MRRPAAVPALPELWADGRFGDALAQLDAALATTPGDGALHAWRALTLVELRRIDDAATSAARAEALAPADRLVRLVCADVALHRGDVATVERQVAWALARDADDADALVLAARARATAGDWRGARAAAQLALSHVPEHEGAAVLVALAVEQRAPAHTGAATEAWAEVAARFPANAIARTRLGWAALRAGDARTARDTFETALVLDPADEGAREGLVAAIASQAPWHGAVLAVLQWLGAMHPVVRVLLHAAAGATALAIVAGPWPAAPPARALAAACAAGLGALAIIGWVAPRVLDATALLSRRGRELVRGGRRVRAVAGVALLAAMGAATAVPVLVPALDARAVVAPLAVAVLAALAGRRPGGPRGA